MRIRIGAEGAGVRDADRGVLRNLTDDAETEVELILELVRSQLGDAAVGAHLQAGHGVGVAVEVRPTEISLDGDRQHKWTPH